VSALLEVKNLKTYFNVGLDKVARAVDGISFKIEQGKHWLSLENQDAEKLKPHFQSYDLLLITDFTLLGKSALTKKIYQTLPN